MGSEEALRSRTLRVAWSDEAHTQSTGSDTEMKNHGAQADDARRPVFGVLYMARSCKWISDRRERERVRA